MDAKTIREQTIRDAKSNLILDAARKVFSEKGFHESRLEDIAASAGFSKASLYNYFSDKEQIFLSLEIRDFEELLAKIHNGLSGSENLITTIEFILRIVFTFFGEHITFFWEAANFHSICNFDMRIQSHQELVSRLHKYFDELQSAIVNVLHEARIKGEITSTIDETILSQFIASLVRGAIFEWKFKRTVGDIEKTIREIMEFSAHGLGYDKKMQ